MTALAPLQPWNQQFDEVAGCGWIIGLTNLRTSAGHRQTRRLVIDRRSAVDHAVHVVEPDLACQFAVLSYSSFRSGDPRR